MWVCIGKNKVGCISGGKAVPNFINVASQITVPGLFTNIVFSMPLNVGNFWS